MVCLFPANHMFARKESRGVVAQENPANSAHLIVEGGEIPSAPGMGMLHHPLRPSFPWSPSPRLGRWSPSSSGVNIIGDGSVFFFSDYYMMPRETSYLQKLGTFF